MNSELYDKTYKLPPEVIKHLQTTLTSNPHGEGVKRAKFLLNNGVVTYQALKRIKNFFDNYNGENLQQYQLAGGDVMKSFIERTLNQDRDAVKRSKDVKQDITVDPYLGNKPQQTPRLNEEDDAVSDALNDGVTKNALAIIINDNNQILLLRRTNTPGIWQPGKWALVGGGVEEGETPIKACQREIYEETGIPIKKFSEKYIIQRNPDSVEHVFVCKYDGDHYDIDLDTNENDQYGWFLPQEIRFLDHVPNLIDYINLAFKKYE